MREKGSFPSVMAFQEGADCRTWQEAVVKCRKQGLRKEQGLSPEPNMEIATTFILCCI